MSPEAGSHARATILNWNIDRGKHLNDIEGQMRQLEPELCIFQEVDLDARRSGGHRCGQETGRRIPDELRVRA